MTTWLMICVLPLLTLALARRGRSRKPGVFMLAEYAAYAALLFAAEMALLVPLGRVTVRWLAYGYTMPEIAYGTVAMAASAVMAAALGLIAPKIKTALGVYGDVCPKAEQTIMHRIMRLFCALLLLALVMMTVCFFWARANYGNVSLEEIMFHLNMPMEGTDTFVSSLVYSAVLPAALISVLLMLLLYMPVRHTWWVRARALRGKGLCVFPLRLPRLFVLALCVLWAAYLWMSADNYFKISSYLVNQLRQSSFIEEYYVNPRDVAITFPEEKRNLITIYVESAETSSQDKESGGFFDVNYTPEMTRIARENVSFSHSGLLEGAAVAPACGWTIAGLTAETAGLPLKLYKQQRGKAGIDNSMDKYDTFMPGATTLGDILKEAGYTTMFMCGSDFEFGGRELYFTQHGNYIVRDWYTAVEQGRIPDTYWVNWGFEDEKLYAWAKEELTALAASDQPFHFSMLTVDTHAPDGYICALCPDTYEESLANVLVCSSKQLDDFLNWLKEQPFYENTSVVVVGDHASMQANFYAEGEMDTHSGTADRKVYNAFINCPVEPVREEGRKFTTLDFFPTTLAAVGATIEGDRLGLGTNLYSARETIAEEVGYETMFDELSRKSNFYNEEIFYPQ